MSIFVSPFNPVQGAGVRAKNPPDLVVASRAPTTKDFGYFPGQLWLFLNNSYYGMLNNHIAGQPAGLWVLFGAGGSPLTNINGVAPIAGQINLVANETVPAIPDGIVITAPSTQGPANTIGIGVLVDGVTIQLNAFGQLEAIGAASSILQITVDSGAPNPVLPVANNINLQGNQPGNLGAIDFVGGPAGQIFATVLPDNLTIEINPLTGRLQEVATFILGPVTTPTLAPFSARTSIIPIPAGSAFYVEADIIGANAALTNFCGGKQQGVVKNLGGVITFAGMQNAYLAEDPVLPPGQQDFQFDTAVGGFVVTFFGSPVAMDWKAKVQIVAIP